MKTVPTVMVAAMLCIIAGCAKKESATQNVSFPKEQQAAFVPPADSSVTAEQMKKWLACNSFLDSLSYMYQDSFKVENPARRLACQDDFVKAQNRICVRCGLSGGYEEYLWILNHAGYWRNRPVLDSLGIASY